MKKKRKDKNDINISNEINTKRKEDEESNKSIETCRFKNIIYFLFFFLINFWD